GGPVTINNPVVFFASGIFGPSPLAAPNEVLTLAGPIDLAGGLTSLAIRPGITTVFSGVMRDGAINPTVISPNHTAGTLVLKAANIYTGGTTVNAGTLLVDNTSGSGTGTSFVDVDGIDVFGNIATLGGSGTIAGPVTIGDLGALAPGDGPGTLTVGPLSLSDR